MACRRAGARGQSGARGPAPGQRDGRTRGPLTSGPNGAAGAAWRQGFAAAQQNRQQRPDPQVPLVTAGPGLNFRVAPSKMSEFADIVDTILEAYRSREVVAVGCGFSLSQQNNFSCSQMLSQSHAAAREWISSSCRDHIERIPVEDLHFLLREV
jgi:hypothetical protein